MQTLRDHIYRLVKTLILVKTHVLLAQQKIGFE